MEERPLRIPLLLGATPGGLPPDPRQIASWTSSAEASRTQVALAYPDNSIYFTSVPSSSTITPSRKPSGQGRGSVPTIVTPSAPGSTPSAVAAGKRPSHAGRSASYAGPPAASSGAGSGRSRAPSTASSVLTTTSSRGIRRIPALSPPTSPPVATTSVSNAFALGKHENLSADGLDSPTLREHLREQSRPSADNDRGGLGLGGLERLGRRGVSGVRGKEERVDGLSSPKSVLSDDSNRTLGSRITGWWSGNGERGMEARDVSEMIAEVEVEREMEREIREDKREKEEQEVVERARRTPLSTPGTERSPVLDEGAAGEGKGRVFRVPLRDAGRGRVVRMKVLEGWGICVLRDIGYASSPGVQGDWDANGRILDIISTTTFDCIGSINLEEPEDKPSATAGSSKNPLRLSPFWQWRSLHLASVGSGKATTLVAAGVPWPCPTPSPNGEVTRVVMITSSEGKYDIAARLELPGEGHVGLVSPSPKDSVTSYVLNYDPAPLRPPTPAGPPRTATPLPRAVSTALANLPLRSTTPSNDAAAGGGGGGLRGVKSMMVLREDAEGEVKSSLKKLLRGKEKVQKEEVKSDTWALGEGREVTRDGYGEWSGVGLHANGEGVGWGKDAVDLFVCDGRNLRVRGSIPLDEMARGGGEVKDASFSEGWHCVAIRTDNGLLLYGTPTSTKKGKEQAIKLDLQRSIDEASGAYILPNRDIIFAAKDSLRKLDLPQARSSATVLQKFVSTRRTELSSVIPLDVETCFTSDDRGNISKRKLSDLLSGQSSCSDSSNPQADRLDSAVSCLRLFQWDGTTYLVAGDHDGVVRIWDATKWELQGSFILFAWPVYAIALLDMPQAGSLRACLLCTSEAGTVGIIDLRQMEQLFLMPAARTPLRRIFMGGEDVMLAYTNGKARVWNVESMEFRRSTGLDAAEDMLSSGDWAEVDLEMPNYSPDNVLSSALGILPTDSDAGRMMMLDLRKLGKWLHDARSTSDRSPLGVLRVLLSMLLTPGVDAEVDKICQTPLGIPTPKLDVAAGIDSPEGGTSIVLGDGPSAWHASPSISAIRQLAILALVRPFLDSPDDERYAAQVIAFYTASLPSSISEPTLEYFAGYYLDPSPDVHQAARMLFAARLDRMTESEIEEVVSKHSADLPSARSSSTTPALGQDERSAMALTMIGGMAVQKFQCINPTALKAVSESLSLYLHSPDPAHLALGIELTSKGFSTWQTYIDPSDLLRRLFYLSTHPAPTGSNIAAQARLAVLYVANHHATLFMSTLSMDILDAKTVEGRTSIMKLCVYLARKKPQVLEHSLPKIAEAVVKSLDPNLGKMRDDVWQAATVILNELVLAFSTIDFHSGTQKLAVGTHEGSLIMFDLKSASRLYIIQPHVKPVSAVTFSPDGRRLITVSLGDGNLTVWKVGSSISGFFNVGGPPRQGGEKGEPFKRIEFRRAEDGPMDSTSALSDIKIEWPGARQARVTIKETLLTFET